MLYEFANSLVFTIIKFKNLFFQNNRPFSFQTSKIVILLCKKIIHHYINEESNKKKVKQRQNKTKK